MEFERLTCLESLFKYCKSTNCLSDCENCYFGQIFGKLYDLENKIKNRRLVIPNEPCVALSHFSNGKWDYAIVDAKQEILYNNLTKAEAEAKLKELKGEKE